MKRTYEAARDRKLSCVGQSFGVDRAGEQIDKSALQIDKSALVIAKRQPDGTMTYHAASDIKRAHEIERTLTGDTNTDHISRDKVWSPNLPEAIVEIKKLRERWKAGYHFPLRMRTNARARMLHLCNPCAEALFAFEDLTIGAFYPMTCAACETKGARGDFIITWAARVWPIQLGLMIQSFVCGRSLA